MSRKRKGKAAPLEPEVSGPLNQIFAALGRERIARGLTLTEVADLLNVVPSKLSMMERGIDERGRQSNPLMSFILRWAQLFDLRISLTVDTSSLPEKPRLAEWRKLSRDDEAKIVESHGLIPAPVLAKQFGVSVTTIYNVWKRRDTKHDKH